MSLNEHTRIMVTGGSGFIGTNLIEHLRRRAVKVVNFDIAPPLDETHHSDWSPGDVMDLDVLREAVASFRPNTVVHLAAQVDVSVGSRALDFATNWLGTQNLLTVARQIDGRPKIVLASTQFVCQPGYRPAHDTDYSPHTAYGESKAITEQLLRAAALANSWFIVRPTTIWGPWDLRYRRQFYRVMDAGLYFHPSGAATVRSFGFVGNLVAQLCGLLEQPASATDGRVFYVGDPCADIRNYANEYSLQLRGRHVRHIPRLMLATLARLGDAATATGLPFPITTSRYRSMVEDYLVDLAPTLRLVGPGPYTLGDGVQQTLAWLRREESCVADGAPWLALAPGSFGLVSTGDSGSRPLRIVVAGQIPPPVTGQGVMIRALLEQLRRNETIDVEHWPFFFTREASGMRRFSLRKLTAVVRAVIDLVRVRVSGPIDCLVYPSGGPYVVPIVRDFALLPWALAMSNRVLIHFHSGGQAATADTAKGWRRTLFGLLRLLYRRATGAIVMTASNAVDPRRLGIDQVLVLPHHLEDHYRATDPRPADAPVRLLYVGHLTDAKGTPELLRAFAAITAEHPSCVLELVGECLQSPSPRELDRLIDELGIADRVELSGVLTGKSKWAAYARADAFLFPTIATGESFGLVLAEAMMWKLPVLATDWRGNADVLGRPVGGCLVSAEGDLTENVRAGLMFMLTERDRWRQWGDDNRARFEQQFSLQADPYYFGDALRQFTVSHDRASGTYLERQ